MLKHTLMGPVDGVSLYRWTRSAKHADHTFQLCVGTPEDEGRAIRRNAVVEKHGDDGESPKNRSQ
jgi:hypothetical protein